MPQQHSRKHLLTLCGCALCVLCAGRLCRALADEALQQHVLGLLERHGNALRQLEVQASTSSWGNSHWTPLDCCFVRSGFESFCAGLPCINLPGGWPEAAPARATLRRGLECLGVATHPSVETLLRALEVRLESGSAPTPSQLLPLYSWLASRLSSNGATHDDSTRTQEQREEERAHVRRAFLAGGAIGTVLTPSLDGDTSTACRHTLERSVWLEEAEAGVVAGVLGLANLAPSYAGARPLFVDVLDVRRQLSLDELTRALDALSAALMDGPRAFAQMDGQQAYALSEAISSVTAAHVLCTTVYEMLASSTARDTLDGDFFDRRLIFVPLADADGGPGAAMGSIGGAPARFSTSEDVYWFAVSGDEAELAALAGLHALAPHYPAALRSFFVDVLHVSK